MASASSDLVAALRRLVLEVEADLRARITLLAKLARAVEDFASGWIR